MEHWRIVLWENCNGVCYVEKDLLNNLKSKDSLLLERLFKKKITLVQYDIPRLKSSETLKKIENEIWELKFILPKAEIRYLGCLSYSTDPPTFYALCAFRKKTQKILSKYINIARKRYKEFVKNNK